MLQHKQWREKALSAAAQYAQSVQSSELDDGTIRPFARNPFITCSPSAWAAYSGQTKPKDDPHYDACPFMRTRKCFHPGRLQNGHKTVVTVTISEQVVAGNYLPGLEPRRERQVKLCCVEAAYVVGRERRKVGLNVRYTVSPATEAAEKELDSLFGAAPCWDDSKR